jgi:hypothetical protein
MISDNRVGFRKTVSNERKERLCLRCDRSFLSDGASNRLCDACRHSIAVRETPAPEYMVLHQGRPD